ncbi:MAG TPA: diaminopropionate ammonia-lyase [Candidatus Cottocaccamicrobium excrementipullorum]|nr:diaminopropionate ammonia-lyase [Candidatus Cottocaccamicrobium excrementipullorum]
MENEIKAFCIKREEGKALSCVKKFGLEAAEKANAFHRSFPEYQITPLAELNNLADELGVAGIYVKDESYRFGLNAFKVLGGSYAIGRYIAEKVNLGDGPLTYEKLTDGTVKKKLGELTFVTATDGNHGRGVAWTARRLGQKSVVYMPKGSTAERLKNIRELGADASITELNYDDAVRLAKEKGEKNGWIVVQDTSWEGYEKIPGWIMEGYTTMAYEAFKQLEDKKPTHIFLQAGVGAMSGAIAGFFADIYGDRERPLVIIVEPDKADCLFRTAKAGDGKLHPVKSDMDTIMAGLACGEPCPLGWEILKDHADYFISMPDWVAAEGMRVLGNPVGNDRKVISGESGAATMGFVAEILRKERYRPLKEKLGLDETSRILCFSTEGDTDKANYKQIVWDGKYPSF